MSSYRDTVASSAPPPQPRLLLRVWPSSGWLCIPYDPQREAVKERNRRANHPEQYREG